MLPGSTAVDLRRRPPGGAAKPWVNRGFTYSDCWVDERRLVVSTRWTPPSAVRDPHPHPAARTRAARGRRLAADLEDRVDGRQRPALQARALVNAAGPWVVQFLAGALGVPHRPSALRLVKGSHIVVPEALRRRPRLHPPERRQAASSSSSLRGRLHPDRHHRRALRGRPGARSRIAPDEIDYLCRVGQPLLRAARSAPADVVWTYAGRAPALRRRQRQRLGRDPRLRLRARRRPGPAPAAVGLGRQDHDLPQARRGSAGEAAAGDGLHARRLDRRRRPARRRHRRVRTSRRFLRRGPARPPLGARGAAAPLGARLRHAARPAVVGTRGVGSRISAATSAAVCYEAELHYLVEHEWARTADDVLWRRTKLGLHVGQRHGGCASTELLRRHAQRAEAAHRMSLRLDQVRRAVGDEVWIDDLSLDLQPGAALRAARARRRPARPR